MSFVSRIFAFCLVALSLNSYSQRLYDHKLKGPYLLLYKLTPDQMVFLEKNPHKIDSQFLFTNLVGKVSTDSLFPLHKKPVDEFPIKPFHDKIRYEKCFPKFHIWDIKQNGYFLEVNVTGLNQVSYRLIENPLFNAGVHTIGYETFIFVEDTAGLPIYNATVHLDTAFCPFDSSLGGYKIRGKNISGVLKIERAGQFTMTKINGYKDKSNNSKPPRDNYNYTTQWYEGYLVTNKPRYKQWDTLFFKSFLVNSDGKPLKEKLIARLSQNYSGYAKEFKLKRTAKGAYNGYFIINDSFTLDQELTLVLMNKYRTVIKSQTVMLENYELKDIRFEMKADKQLVTPGGGIKFYVTATTANQLPIMDGRLTFKMQLTGINFTDGDSVVITDNKMKNWYSATVQTDPSGVTIFDLPDSVFIPLDGQFLVTCDLLTSDNESRSSSLYFNYQTTRDRQEAELSNDTLKVLRLYNMKSARKPMRVKLWSKKDVLCDSIFYTPINLYLPPNIYIAQIFKGDTITGTFYRQTQLPVVTGKRTHDSIHIFFKSTFDIPVFYRIYANNKLVASGRNTQLAWHAKDKSKNSYHLQYGILDGAVITPRFYSQSFHLAEKELKVDIIQPEIIYPGQEVAIEIQVKDAYGKPVNKVNLAAWAVSTQLEGIVRPDVPYLGLTKTQKPLPTKAWPLVPFQSNYYSFLKDWQIHSFKLYTNDFYKLAYPEKGFQVLTDTTPHNTTEIEFYAHGKFIRQNIIYVKANDTLLFTERNTYKPGVIRIKPGIYNFSIRTFDRLYHFKNVEIKSNKKNFVCLNLDSLKKLNLGDSMSMGILDSLELDMYRKHTLLYTFDYYLNDTFIIKVNGKIKQGFTNYNPPYHINKVIVSTPLYNPDRTVKDMKSRQEYFMFGQLNEGDEVELYWKNNYSHLIKFKPDQLVRFTSRDLVSEPITNWTKELRYLSMQNQDPYVFNNFWWDPEYKDTTKPVITKPIPEPPSYSSGELSEFQYPNYSPQYKLPVVSNSKLYLYIANVFSPKRIWLFNRIDSSYSILENGFTFNHSYPAIGMNARQYIQTQAPKKQLQNFRLVMEINDSTWYVKNLSIDSSLTLFLTIKPSQFRKLGKTEHIFYDRLAKNLTRADLIPWLDSPTVNKGMFVIPLKQLNGKTNIEGTVIGPNIKYPVENAFVVLEKNGLYVRGAFTNREGRFYMEDLLPGTYMLKVKSNQYHYWLHYSLEVTGGFTYLVQVEMKPYSWIKYNIITSRSNLIGTDSDDWMGNSSNAPMNESHSYNASATELESVHLVRKSAKVISIQKYSFAGRTDGSRIYQDGVALIGSKNESEGEVGYFDKEDFKSDLDGATDSTSPGWNKTKQKAEEDRLAQMSGDKNAKRTRKDFKDYAYWVPNLYTNKQGKAGFSVKYPDNVTSWQTFVPAMDGRRHSGLGEMTVRSYKPITTSLALPLFLTEGDTLMAYGRVMNYTGKNQLGKYLLKNNQATTNKEIDIKDIYTDSLKVLATNPGDTLKIEASIELPNGYRDAEMRNILINAGTVISGKSLFEEIAGDTTLTFKAENTDMGMDIAVYNQKLALIIEMIDKIETMSIYDNRSLAAYLNALLIKKTVCKTLNIPFTQERKIRETMSKLKKAQGDNGLFSWFKGGRQNFMVSTYVAEVMYKAHTMGYENNTWLNAARNMEKNMASTANHERLEYLLTLKKLNRTFFYDSFIRSLKPNVMDKSEKLQYWRLMQLLGKKFPIEEVNEMLEYTEEGNLKVAGIWDWKIAPITDDAANTYKAWQILFDAKAHTERRKALVDYMATECNSHGNSWIKAAEAMLAEAVRDTSLNTNFKPEVYVNGVLIPAEKMPATYHLMPGQSLTLKHSGSPVYVAANRKFRTYNPITDDTQFRIEVAVPHLKANRFIAGVPVDMKVTVFAKRNQYNTIIEVPIPAGCVYGTKIQSESGAETHREYQTDRVLIFSDELPFGYHTFTIRLVPRFNGTFYTAPARSALMFYPDKAAFTPKKRWTIGK